MTRSRTVAILALPGVQLLDVSGPLDVFAEANAQAGREEYRPLIVASTAGEIRSSSGVRLMPDLAIGAPPGEPIHTLLVAGCPNAAEISLAPAVTDWLRQAAPATQRYGSVCNGAFFLAATGLLDGKRIATHWAVADQMAKAYPSITVEPDAIYVRDGRLRTAAGVTAGLDLALALVEEDLGSDTAMKVASQLVMFFKRPGGQMQFSRKGASPPAGRSALQKVQRFVEANPALRHSVANLAVRAGLNPRRFARLLRGEAPTARDFASLTEHILDGRRNLARYFELSMEYSALYDAYNKRGIINVLDKKDKEFGHNIEHYFGVGADALRLVVESLVDNLRSPPKTILDFPSGSGRVTRHLCAFFPQANITVCDLYDYHVHFCADTFGVEGIISEEDLNKFSFAKKFDLIFCGSLVTHLPADLFEATLRLVSESLSESGIAIITVHGRHSEYRQHIPELRYFDYELFESAETEIAETGFGYADYDQFRKGIFHKQSSYGVSFSRPHWTMKLLERDYSKRILGYIERGWDGHQDVLVLGGPALNL